MSQSPNVPKPPVKTRTWCFTVNNWTESDLELLSAIPVTYIVHGKEVSASGTPHLQGYLTLRSPQRLSMMKKYHPKAHWEPARSVEASKRYCKKDGNFAETVHHPLTPAEETAVVRAELALLPRMNFPRIFPRPR